VVNAHVFAADRKNVGGTPAEYRATLSKNAAGVPVLFHVTDSRRGETMLRLSVNWKR
jgi:hypothetical protein